LLSTANGTTPDELDNYVVRLNAADGTLFLDESHLARFEVGYREFQNGSVESTNHDAIDSEK
jgi:hypothetical protein